MFIDHIFNNIEFSSLIVTNHFALLFFILTEDVETIKQIEI